MEKFLERIEITPGIKGTVLFKADPKGKRAKEGMWYPRRQHLFLS